jgi:hypothetical protein
MRPILIFYSELMPYNILVLKELVKADCLLYVLKWSQNRYLFQGISLLFVKRFKD